MLLVTIDDCSLAAMNQYHQEFPTSTQQKAAVLTCSLRQILQVARITTLKCMQPLFASDEHVFLFRSGENLSSSFRLRLRPCTNQKKTKVSVSLLSNDINDVCYLQ